MSNQIRIVTRESLKQEKLARRIATLEAASVRRPEMIDQLKDGVIPNASMGDNFNLKEQIRLISDVDGKTVAEFVSAGSIPQAFFERQRYEVDAGRDEHPLVFPTIYNVVNDTTLPEMFDINVLGPIGAVFTKIEEGGEVKFSNLGSSEKSVRLYQWAAGIEYSERIFRFNNQFRLPFIERQFGIAANAVQDDIHLSPIIDFSYAASNQTAASSVGTTLQEKYHNTLDAAIQHSRDDATWPRRGPYVLLVNSANMSTVRKAVERVQQQGFTLQSPEVFDQIRTVVAYDGWTGTRGKKTVTYDGVPAGKAYLINMAFRAEDFQSFFQQPLRMQRGDGDLSRFIVEQVIWDMWLGVYAGVRAAVEEITWPTS